MAAIQAQKRPVLVDQSFDPLMFTPNGEEPASAAERSRRWVLIRNHLALPSLDTGAIREFYTDQEIPRPFHLSVRFGYEAIEISESQADEYIRRIAGARGRDADAVTVEFNDEYDRLERWASDA